MNIVIQDTQSYIKREQLKYNAIKIKAMFGVLNRCMTQLK